MKVSNRGCIRRLSLRALLASRTRNLVAVLAIALTAVLFTSLFTIALSINEGIQQNNFRQAGGWSHGSFKYLTEEQFEELKDDPLIESWGLRRFVGMPRSVPFNKSHVEIGYSDANEAHWGYCDPIEGRLPQEGTDEAATDTHVLALLGVEPQIGAKFTVTFEVDGHETTQTFTLSGWWEYDEAIVANHILIPESRADAILAEVGVTPPGSDGMTGSWNLDVMLKNGARSIASDLEKILANHGYQSETAGEDYISTGVNWGYTGAQLSDKLDPAVVVIIVGVLLLILLTGYLVIYNVFQISVAGDIRFYGLLKTIGTTPRQLRRIIRQQALTLSLAGIPLGLIVGWFIGGQITPAIVSQLDGIVPMTSVSPVIFLGAALFSLVTVLLSCRKPGRVAAKVSPIEAVRYTEGGAPRRKIRRKEKGVSLFSMAWANLGRSRGKTAVIDGLVFRNVEMQGVKAPFVINMFYFCDPDGHSDYVQCRQAMPVDDYTPRLGSLTMEDIRATGAQYAGCYFDGLPEMPIGEVVMKDVRIAFDPDAQAGQAAMADGRPLVKKLAIYAENVQKIELHNVRIEGYEGERLQFANVGSFEED